MQSFKAPEFLVGTKAGEDFTGKIHKAYKLDANGNLVVAGLGEGLGTVFNETTNGSTAIEGTTIGGGSMAIASGAIAIGDRISSDAAGDAKVAAIGETVFGIATEAATVGQHFSYLNVLYVQP